MKSRATVTLKQLALSAIVAATSADATLLDIQAVATANIIEDLRNIRRKPCAEDERVVHLAQILQLEDVELLSLATAIAVETDPKACRLVGVAQAPVAGARPTLGLLATAFHMCGPPQHLIVRLSSGKACLSGCLALGGEDAPLPERTISIARVLLDALMQGVATPQGIRILPQPSHAIPDTLQQAIKSFSARLSALSGSGIVLRSNSEAEALSTAALVAQQLGLKAALVMPDAPTIPAAWLLAAKAIPVFHAYAKPGECKFIPDLNPYDGPWLCVTSHSGLTESRNSLAMNWHLPSTSQSVRAVLWRANGVPTETAALAAHKLRVGPHRIAKLAKASAAAMGGAADKVSWSDIENTIAMDAQSSLAGLAQKIDGRISEHAFICPKLIAERMQVLLGRCRLREGLANKLGPAASARYHAGVRALFHGASGTGKSLGAQWLATQLGLPIYRVDLAAVTSKWIGETEKNIGQLLSAAEEADVVLLFDEADSLFSSRTDVGNANDRHANSQTNYLLQRLESHEGIVILTSNARERLDGAFTRRLDAIIEFPMPDVDARRDIWRAHLAEGGLPENDINHLAAVIDLAGGHVRNLVLSATVLALGDTPTLPHVIAAAKSEYQKLGRQVPRELELT